MTDWAPTKLGELVAIKHGYAFRGEHFRDGPPGDILLTPGNFAIGGGFQLGKVKYYAGPPAPGYVLVPGELLVTMTDLSKAGDTLGYPAIVPDDGRRYLHNQRLGKVEIRDPRIGRDFVYWLMRTRPYRDEILSGVTGSTVKHTSPKKIEAFEFALPPLVVQNAICGILNPLDDKNELNRRMNETLEAIAQTVFRDWFVDFGPVRRKLAGETDPVVIMGGLTPDPARAAEMAALFPAAMGEDGLPEGWGSSTVGAAFNITMGQSPPGETYNEAGVGLPFFQGRTDFGFRYPERRKYCSAPSRLADPDDTLISVRAPVGDLNVAWERCCVGRGVAAARHKLGGKSYTFYALRSLQPELQSFEHTGTVFGAINKRQLEQLAIADPPEVLVRSFEALVGPMDDRIRLSVAESRTLAETRDYLLPRLMSGQVRVRDAAVGEANP